MAKFWRPGTLQAYAQGNTWTGSTLQASNFKNVMDFDQHSTVLRSRMTASMMIGLSDVASYALTDQLPQFVPSKLGLGLWADGAVSPSGSPSAMFSNPYDGFWLQHNALSLQQFFVYTDTDGTHKALARWGIPEGTWESFAQRGPATAQSAIFLVWDFSNHIQNVWTTNTASQQGLISIQVDVHCLFETP